MALGDPRIRLYTAGELRKLKDRPCIVSKDRGDKIEGYIRCGRDGEVRIGSNDERLNGAKNGKPDRYGRVIASDMWEDDMVVSGENGSITILHIDNYLGMPEYAYDLSGRDDYIEAREKRRYEEMKEKVEQRKITCSDQYTYGYMGSLIPKKHVSKKEGRSTGVVHSAKIYDHALSQDEIDDDIRKDNKPKKEGRPDPKLFEITFYPINYL